MVAPVVSSVVPPYGQISAQTNVIIKGSGFNADNPLLVQFGSKYATSVVVIDDNTITCVSPVESSVLSVPVYVINNSGEKSVFAENAQFYYLNSLASPQLGFNNPYFDPLANYIFYGDVEFVKGVKSSGSGAIFDTITVNSQSNLKGTTIFSGVVGGSGLETINLHSSVNNILTAAGTFNMASVNSYIRLECLNAAMQLESKGLSAKFLTSNAVIYGDGTNDFYLGSEGVPPVAADQFKDVKIDAAQLLSLRAGGTVGIISNGTIQIGDSNTNAITLGSANTDFIFSTGIAKEFKIGGLPSIAPAGTIKPLLIETAGPNEGKVYIST